MRLSVEKLVVFEKGKPSCSNLQAFLKMTRQPQRVSQRAICPELANYISQLNRQLIRCPGMPQTCSSLPPEAYAKLHELSPGLL